MRETSRHGLKSLRLSLKVMSVEQPRRPGRDFSIQKCPRPYDTKRHSRVSKFCRALRGSSKQNLSRSPSRCEGSKARVGCSVTLDTGSSGSLSARVVKGICCRDAEIVQLRLCVLYGSAVNSDWKNSPQRRRERIREPQRISKLGQHLPLIECGCPLNQIIPKLALLEPVRECI